MTLNGNVVAVGGYLSKLVEAHHAIDLSLSTGFESVGAVLQTQRRDKDSDKTDS